MSYLPDLAVKPVARVLIARREQVAAMRFNWGCRGLSGLFQLCRLDILNALCDYPPKMDFLILTNIELKL